MNNVVQYCIWKSQQTGAFSRLFPYPSSRKAIEMGLTLSEYGLENKVTGEKDWRKVRDVRAPFITIPMMMVCSLCQGEGLCEFKILFLLMHSN